MNSGFGCLFCWEASHSVLALELFFSPECRPTHSSQLVGRKGTDFTQHMESQWGTNKADRWYCPLYLQKTINPHSSPSWWLVWTGVSSTQRRRTREKRCSWTLWHFLLLWPRRCRTTIFLAARKACSLCHNKEHKTEMEWGRGHLILCQAIYSDLFIQFRCPQFLWSTKTLWMTSLSMSFIFPAQSLSMTRACCCSTTRRGVNDVWDPVAHS